MQESLLLCVIFHKSKYYGPIERINVNHKSIEERTFQSHGSAEVAFVANYHCHQAKKTRGIKDRGRRKAGLGKEKRRKSVCVSEEAWESFVHRGELRKCGKEEKHDQSSRSSAVTVNHTRAQVHKQETGSERERKVRWREDERKVLSRRSG